MAVEELAPAVREALRLELGTLLASDGLWREALRSELAVALKRWDIGAQETFGRLRMQVGDQDEVSGDEDDAVLKPEGALISRRSHLSAPQEESCVGTLDQNRAQNVAFEDRQREEAMKHFARFMVESKSVGEESSPLSKFLNAATQSRLILKLDDAYAKWQNIEEPVRTGVLADIVTSKAFEIFVCFVIFLNCTFMVYSTNHSINNLDKPSLMIMAGDWAFQCFYTVELILRIAVHREFFFISSNWRLSWYDLFLVISGYVGILGDAGIITGTFLRILRLVKLGKAMRAVKIMAQLKHLRAFLVCLQGSFESLIWSIVMLLMVFMIFSLCLMQWITVYLEGADLELEGDLKTMFGSVTESMLTLYKAATGGDDWARAYDVIAVTGAFGSFIYLVYISFVQLALINIITGIFVESAMQTLTPDRETVALEHFQQEKENARELERLCKHVDHDLSGKLTPEQFKDGMEKGRIPTLLTLLGLSRHHVLEFFETMSAAAREDNGQVNISHFVAGCMRLKGAATNFDVQMLHAQLQSLGKAVDSIVAEMREGLYHLESRVRL